MTSQQLVVSCCPAHLLMQRESVYLRCWLAFFLMANPLALIHPPLIWCFPLPPHLPSSSEPKGSWQRQRGFWDPQPYEFFIHLSQPTLASPPLLSFLAIASALPLSLTSIVCCSGCDSAPGMGRANKQKKQASKQWDAGAHSHSHAHTHSHLFSSSM